MILCQDATKMGTQWPSVPKLVFGVELTFKVNKYHKTQVICYLVDCDVTIKIIIESALEKRKILIFSVMLSQLYDSYITVDYNITHK